MSSSGAAARDPQLQHDEISLATPVYHCWSNDTGKLSLVTALQISSPLTALSSNMRGPAVAGYYPFPPRPEIYNEYMMVIGPGRWKTTKPSPCIRLKNVLNHRHP